MKKQHTIRGKCWGNAGTEFIKFGINPNGKVFQYVQGDKVPYIIFSHSQIKKLRDWLDKHIDKDRHET